MLLIFSSLSKILFNRGNFHGNWNRFKSRDNRPEQLYMRVTWLHYYQSVAQSNPMDMSTANTVPNTLQLKKFYPFFRKQWFYDITTKPKVYMLYRKWTGNGAWRSTCFVILILDLWLMNSTYPWYTWAISIYYRHNG